MSDTDVPEELFYTTEHEWIQQISETKIRVGITDFAQDQLGDIVYVQLPEFGRTVAQGDSLAEVESTKSVSDIYAPFSGTIASINDQLADCPELINSDPYGEGWIADIELTVDEIAEALEQSLDAEAYKKIIVDN